MPINANIRLASGHWMRPPYELLQHRAAPFNLNRSFNRFQPFSALG
jgi:hypothetical protein